VSDEKDLSSSFRGNDLEWDVVKRSVGFFAAKVANGKANADNRLVIFILPILYGDNCFKMFDLKFADAHGVADTNARLNMS
jgi:hypothetical protein